MKYLLVPLATAAALFATTTIASAETGTPPGAQFQSERVMLMDTQMDKVTAGDVRDAQKRQAKRNKVPFGQCKTGPGTSQCR